MRVFTSYAFLLTFVDASEKRGLSSLNFASDLQIATCCARLFRNPHYAVKYAKFAQLMKMSCKIYRLDVDNKYEITVMVRY